MLKASSSGAIRALFVVGGMVFLVLTAGFFLQMGWAKAMWPWPAGSRIFSFLLSQRRSLRR